MSKPRKTQYLIFVLEDLPHRKTPIVQVRSRSNEALLGTIRWFGQWRQFCFYPQPLTIFNAGCMKDIQVEIAGLMEERRLDRQRSGEIC